MVPGQAGGRRAAVLLVLLAGLGSGSLAGAAPAAAHATLVDTSPRQGETSASSPDQVVLRFSEPVTVLDGSLVVSDLQGERWDLETVTTTDAGHTVSVDVPSSLPDGQYLVSWRLLSLDTHVTGGSIDFTVGTGRGTPGASTTGPETPGPASGTSLVGAAARGIVAAGSSLLAGVALTVLALGRRHASGLVTSPRIRWLEATGLGLVVLGTGLGLTTQAVGLGDRAPVPLLDTGAWAGVLAASGPWLLARTGALLGWAGLWTWQARRTRGRRDGPGRTSPIERLSTVALAVVLATSIAAGGHAGAEPDPWLTLTVTTAHVLAASIWVGGLALLAPHLRGPWRTTLVLALPAWSSLALTAVGVLVVTGTLQAARAVGHVAALWSTGYGQLLLAKTLAVIGLLLVANVARRVVSTPQQFARPVLRLRRTVLGETSLVAVVLALSAALATSAPGRTTYSPPWTETVQLGPVVTALSIQETRHGPQVVRVVLREPGGAEVLPDALGLTITHTEQGIGPLPIVLRRDYSPAATDRAQATVYVSEPTVVPAPGTWDIEVLLTLDEVTAYSATVSYETW